MYGQYSRMVSNQERVIVARVRYANLIPTWYGNLQIISKTSKLIFYFRASLDNVYFPSVTLCNINQGRRSFFVSKGLSHESPLLGAVLSQAQYIYEDGKLLASLIYLVVYSFPSWLVWSGAEIKCTVHVALAKGS